MIAPILFGFGKSNRLKPDVLFEDGDDLSEFGCNGKVVHIPGHSRGSIGILTADGSLICGDLLENTKMPRLNSIMDDLEAAKASIDKLSNSPINTVYPGHGRPFPIDGALSANLDLDN